MRILYGVVGEGMGHAMRSGVVVDHLTRNGHEVEIMASQGAVAYLRGRFPAVRAIHGFHIVNEDNRVRRGKTFWSNALSGAIALPQQMRSYFDLVEGFEPEVAISDFESWVYFFAKAHRLPIISLDNQQIINRCIMPDELMRRNRADFEATRMFIKSKLPFCDHYIITTFFSPPLRKPKTTLVPPILRPEVLEAESTQGDHLLVYQNAGGTPYVGGRAQKVGYRMPESTACVVISTSTFKRAT